jgi:hypothetical protein
MPRRAGADAPTEVSDAATTPMPAAHGRPLAGGGARSGRRWTIALVTGIAVVAVVGLGGLVVVGRLARTAPPPARVDTVRVQDTVHVAQPAATRPPPRARQPAPAPPAASPGYLTVNADPYGELYVDGVDVGPTPVVRYAVPAGVHTIKVVREGYRTVTEKVQVDAGNTVPKRYTLLPGG